MSKHDRYQRKHKQTKKRHLIPFTIVLVVLLITFSGELYLLLTHTFFHSAATTQIAQQTTKNTPAENQLTATNPKNLEQTIAPIDEQAKTIDSSLKEHKFIGTALAVKDGQIILQQGYGYANYEKKVKNDAHSLFQIGSVQKNMTAVLIMKQVAAGNLTLDEPLSTFYPTVPGSSMITIRNMLTMTSGLSATASPKALLSDESIIQFALSHINFQNYGQWHYQAINYVLLVGILSQLTGKDYYQLFKEQLIQPLSLQHTLFFKDFYNNIAHSQSYSGKDPVEYTTPIPESVVNYNNELGTGNLGMSTGDLYRYFHAFAADELITPEIKAELWTPDHDNQYQGGVYNYMDHFRSRGVENGFTAECYMSNDGQNAVILLSNRMPEKGNYSKLAEDAFTTLTN